MIFSFLTFLRGRKVPLWCAIVFVVALYGYIAGTAFAQGAEQSEPTLPLVRVFYRPDGGVSITHFLAVACKNNDTLTQCMDRVTETLPEKDWPYDDMPLSSLPPDRKERDKWRGSKGNGVWVDHSLVTAGDKIREYKQKLDAELDKENPNATKVLKIQRVLEKAKDIDHTILTAEEIQSLEERQSFVASVASAVSNFFGGILESIKNGFLALRSLVTEKLEVGSPEMPSGITIYDVESGKPFCVVVKGGKLENIPGECGSIPIPPAATSSGQTLPPAEEPASTQSSISAPPVGQGNESAIPSAPGGTSLTEEATTTPAEGAIVSEVPVGPPPSDATSIESSASVSAESSGASTTESTAMGLLDTTAEPASTTPPQ